MSAKIIVIANQKGGVGKTSITMTLAGTLANKNHKTLVLDADPQATATRWMSTASDEKPFPAAVVGVYIAGEKIHREIKKFIDDYIYILVDCPPAADSPIAQSALLVADLVLIPLIPSPPDIWAALSIRKAIDNAKIINENLMARIVINMHQEKTNISKEILNLLPQFEIPILKTTIRTRVSFKESAALGCTLQDLGKKAAASIDEIENLTQEIIKLFNDSII